jgi:superfamily II DNA or RNA helicase
VGRLFGLTATDYRSDGKDVMITAGCGDVIIKRDIIWGVKNGWLAEPVFVIKNVHTTGIDYRDDKLKNYREHVLNSKVMNDQILKDAMLCLEKNKKFLLLVDQVEHGEALSKLLGVPFATGKDNDSEKYIKEFNAGKIPGLIGTDSKIGEGVDTRPVEVLILANFMAAKGPVMQAIGRGLRKHGDKKFCVVLDYCPTGSAMLSRHSDSRIGYYQEITSKVKIL